MSKCLSLQLLLVIGFGVCLPLAASSGPTTGLLLIRSLSSQRRIQLLALHLSTTFTTRGGISDH